MRTVIGISGASGSVFGVELLKRCPGETYAILSRWGQQVLKEETGLGRAEIAALATRLFSDTDLSAPLASGSNAWDAMVVLPCSTSTIGKIATGIADSLMTRAAAVTLKEGRRLVLCPRETPLTAVTLRQLAELAGDGVTVMPVSPGWYGRPETLDDLVQDFVGRVLQALGVGQQGGWKADELEGETPSHLSGDFRIELLEPEVVSAYRAMTPAQRLAAAFDLMDFARAVVRAGIRERHPQWSDREIELELARRVLGDAGKAAAAPR